MKNMNESELKSKQIEFKKELMKLQGQATTGTNPQNPGQIGKLKKDIARIKTILNQRKEVKTHK